MGVRGALVGAGHADVTLKAAKREVSLRSDDPKTGEREHHAADEVVVSVPDKAKNTVPKEDAYRFLGKVERHPDERPTRPMSVPLLPGRVGGRSASAVSCRSRTEDRCVPVDGAGEDRKEP
ncbi:hypothetical protein [Streptomyces azureus]|nr:hypothetical protein [Streptomyces azureus]